MTVQQSSPVTVSARSWWWPGLLPACMAALAAAGFAAVSVAAAWQRFPAAYSCSGKPGVCASHPVAQTAGVIAAAVAAVALAAAATVAAATSPQRPGRRTGTGLLAAAAGVLAALAAAVAVTARQWTSHQELAGFGGPAATLAVVAAAAAGLLTFWSWLTGPRSARYARWPGVAAVVIAAAIAMTAGTSGWNSLSVDATTAPPVPAALGPAPAPSRIRLIARAPAHVSGDEVAVAAGLILEQTAAGGRIGVEAIDPATRQVRWRHLRSDHGDYFDDFSYPPVTAVMSPQAVALFYPGLPEVFLNAATGQPEPLTRPAQKAIDARTPGQYMLGTTYVQLTQAGKAIRVTAWSATTGTFLWTGQIPGCRGFAVYQQPSASLSDEAVSAAVTRAGTTIAVAYQCISGTSLTTRLALFGPGGHQRDITADPGIPGQSTYARFYQSATLLAAGNTVLVSINGDETAVNAATGAVAWHKPEFYADAVLGSGQVVLAAFGGSTHSCGRYAADSGRLLAAYPPATCAALGARDPGEIGTAGVTTYTYAAGRVYASSVHYSSGPVRLTMAAIEPSSGAILATTVIALPQRLAPQDYFLSEPQAAGSMLIFVSDHGNACCNILGAR